MDENIQPPSVSEVWAEIKQSVKKEITSFPQRAKERPVTTIVFSLVAFAVLVGGLFLMFYFHQKAGHIDSFLIWWQTTAIGEKLIDSLIYIGRIVLGLVLIYFLVIKPPKGFFRWTIYPPFVPRFSEKTEQAIIQAPVKAFDCVYYSIKNRFFSNKK